MYASFPSCFEGKKHLLCSRRKILIQQFLSFRRKHANTHTCIWRIISLPVDMFIFFIDKIVIHSEENYKHYPHTSSSLRKFALYMRPLIIHIWIKWYLTISDPSRLWCVCVVFRIFRLLFEFYFLTCDVEVIWKRNKHSVNMKGWKCAQINNHTGNLKYLFLFLTLSIE